MTFPSVENYMSDGFPQDYLSYDLRPLDSMPNRVLLGGSGNIQAGYLLGDSRVHVGIKQTRGELIRRGLLDSNPDKDPMPGRDYSAMNYYLSGGDGLMTAAVSLDRIMVQQDLEKDFENGREFWYGFPSPTFINAVKAAKARRQGVFAAQVPAIYSEDIGNPDAIPSLYWFLLRQYDIPRGLEDTINNCDGLWARREDVVRQVLESPTTKNAFFDVDKIAFGIAGEVYYYANYDRFVRKIKGAGRVAMKGVGFTYMATRALLGGDPSDVDLDFTSAGDVSGAGAYDMIDGFEGLDNVSLEDGRTAATTVGAEYGKQVHFSGGRVVSLINQSGIRTTITFAPTSSYAKGSDGNQYFMNAYGDVSPV